MTVLTVLLFPCPIESSRHLEISNLVTNEIFSLHESDLNIHRIELGFLFVNKIEQKILPRHRYGMIKSTETLHVP